MKLSKDEILASCAQMCKNTLMETLNIEFVDVTQDTITARM
jgi:1,4-dihydroxy-2-naphthoyl-CoA hydrolase